MRRNVVVALAVVVIFAIAACGESSGSSSRASEGPPSAAGIPNESGRPLIGRHGFLRSCGHAGESAGRCICMANYIESKADGWLNSNYDLYENAKSWVPRSACGS